MEGIVATIFNLLILVFILFGVLWGLIRGLRKSASRVIFLIITAIVTLFVAPLITKALLGIEVPLSITANGETQTTNVELGYWLGSLIDNLVGKDFSQNYPVINDILINIPKALVNVFVFVILFWVLKILLYPLNWLFYKFTFAPKVKDNKAPKQRLFGALVGFACGLIVAFSTLVPFYGIMDIVSTVNTIKINSGKENEISLSKATDGMMDGIISAYNGSVTNILTTYTGIKGLGLLAFDKLTVQNYGNTSTTLRKEVENISTMTKNLDTFLTMLDSYKVDGELKALNKSFCESIDKE